MDAIGPDRERAAVVAVAPVFPDEAHHAVVRRPGQPRVARLDVGVIDHDVARGIAADGDLAAYAAGAVERVELRDRVRLLAEVAQIDEPAVHCGARHGAEDTGRAGTVRGADRSGCFIDREEAGVAAGAVAGAVTVCNSALNCSG
jgi:hypothetical protein